MKGESILNKERNYVGTELHGVGFVLGSLSMVEKNHEWT